MILSSRSHFLVIASAAQCALWVWRSRPCHYERSAAISVFYRWRTEKREIASQARNDSRRASGARRSRLYGVGKQIKARLLRRLSCHREERSDLAFPKSANGQKRDCRAALAMTRCVIARIVAISVVRSWQTAKRDCFAGSQQLR
jgi:hypothetical protein